MELSDLHMDFSQVTEFAVVEPGIYDVVVNEITLETSQTSGNPYLKFKLVIDGGPFDNSFLWCNGPLSDKGMGITKGLLKGLGVTAEYLAQPFNLAELVPQLIGQKCAAVVEQREYEGQMRANVKKLEITADTATIDVGGTSPAAAPRARKRA